MHLYGDILEAYVAGELSPTTHSAIDVHVSNCLFCAATLAAERSAAAQWERRGWLGRLVRVEEPLITEGPRAEELGAEAA
jgi:anti-sigma factor RsiW